MPVIVKGEMNFKEGEILYIDKPLGWTSFAVVNKIRYLLCRTMQVKKLKVGHAGTLDPLATGVMLVCTGKATKRIEELQGHTKEYVATLKLGATTPSFDMEKDVDMTYPIDHITRQMVDDVLARFVGCIEQVPPIFSACKVDGVHAYDLARKGVDVSVKARCVTIHEIELLQYDMPCITIRVKCSKGTYIRSLARDIGRGLQSGAHLTSLRRTRVGEVTVDKCMQMADFPQWLSEQNITLEE